MTDTRAALRITGSDRADFQQGLVTNDVARLSDGLVYTALLSPQGKYLYDFFMVPDGDGILLDVAEDRAQALGQRLTMYRLRADVQITLDERPVAIGTGPAPEGAFADPRDPALGWRAYGVGTSDGTDWDALRVAHAIPASGAELQPDDSYILEMGFERLNGVDFKKGCYVGQEVTARMKHKTSLRKGLARVHLEGPVDPGTEISKEGKTVGKIHTVSGDKALAYLRFDRVGEGMEAAGISVSAET